MHGTLMTGVGMKDEDYTALREMGIKKKAKINIYGPPGLRLLLRQTLNLTRLNLSATYAVHELLPPSSSSKVKASCACDYQASDPATMDDWIGDVHGLHVNEAPGRDLVADRDGCWRDLVGKCEIVDEEVDEPVTEVSAPASTAEAGDSGSFTPAGEAEPRKRPSRRKASATTPLWRVDAGPIEHRIPSMGYIISEPPQYFPLDTATLLPLLEAEREALAALPEPITNPRSILSRLTSTRQSFTLPSGLVLDPPPPSTEPARKIVIMGDCAGVSNDAFEELAREPSLLVHECTNAWIDPGVEKGEKGARVRTAELDKTIRTAPGSGGTNSPAGTPGGQPTNGAAAAAGPGGEEWIKMEQERVRRILEAKAVVEQKARSRGHSTPDMVGAFARRIGARRVALNHFSAMFPSPHYATDVPFPSLLMETSHHSPGRPLPPIAISELHRRVLMSFIESQTTDAWHPVGGVRATASRDLMTYDIPSHELTDEEIGVIIERTNEADKFQDLWRHEGATGITRAFGIRVAGLDKAISGAGYGHLRPPAPEAREEPTGQAEGQEQALPNGTSVMDSEKAGRGRRQGGRGKRGATTTRGGRGAPHGGGQGRPDVTQQSETGSATSGQPPRKRGHTRAKSTVG
ncbi:hypothetical protein QFC22_005209 [Naganishia vaughanmartiniae]|uniref:Uncharacterized protein n=1 Tax=Naganishia vaughanmartiniae TaxID=1424756 RepID=A0ACC2WXB2_9TREE|nr:hypothetical protein QFC22_005209 [Naganishia vaughanmartiniae]